MFDLIVSEENVLKAHKQTLKGAPKYRAKCLEFNSNLTENLNILVESVKNGSYRPSGYNRFFVYEPKKRLIFSPMYRDKIVHHMINNVLRDFLEPKFIHNSYACIRNKGHRKTVECLRKMSHSCNRSMKDPYVVSIDIEKFFYSINHDILNSILIKRIPCSRTIDLIMKIVDDSPTPVGLPLGNLISQLLANLYLNEVDQYIKHKMKIKNYSRYCDDLIMVVDGKEKARQVKSEVMEFIKTKLNLNPHKDKSQIYHLSAGIKSLGFVYKNGKTILSTRTKNNIKRKMSRVVLENTPREANMIFLSLSNFILIGSGFKFLKALSNRFRFFFNVQNNHCTSVRVIPFSV